MNGPLLREQFFQSFCKSITLTGYRIKIQNYLQEIIPMLNSKP